MSAVLKEAIQSALQIPLQIPAKLLALLDPWQFKIIYGGRGGAKSHTIAQILLAMAANRRLRILCVREVQKSLEESSMQVLKHYIQVLGLGAHFSDIKSEIRGWNGSKFSFTGLQDHTAESIKSFEGYDIVWVEEGQSVTARSYNILIPTIVRKTGAEIWVSLNLDEEDGYINQRFIVGNDPDALVIEMNWRDNPWFNDAMNAERLKLKAINDDLYQHIWEGKCRAVAGLLFKRHWIQYYDVLPTRLNKYIASDYGGGIDPDNPDSNPDETEHGVLGMTETGDVYAIDWWFGQDDPAVCIDKWIELVATYKPDVAFDEKGVLLRALDSAIKKRMRETDTYVRRIALASASSKADRALGFAARAAAGTFYVPRNKPWAIRLVNQLCAFNGQDGRADGGVDVLSLFGRGLDYMHNAQPAEEKKPDPPEPFTDAWFAAREQSGNPDEAAQQRYYR